MRVRRTMAGGRLALGVALAPAALFIATGWAQEKPAARPTPKTGASADSPAPAVDSSGAAANRPASVSTPQPKRIAVADRTPPQEQSAPKKPLERSKSDNTLKRSAFPLRTSRDETSGRRDQKPAQSSGVGGFFSTLTALAVVIVCIVVLATIVRRWMPGLGLSGSSTALRVLGRTLLAPRQSVYIVRCGRRVLVLGVTNDHIRLLSEVRDPDEVTELAGLCEQDRPSSVTNTFREVFSRQSTELDAEADADETGQGEAVREVDFQGVQTELRDLTDKLHQWRRGADE